MKSLQMSLLFGIIVYTTAAVSAADETKTISKGGVSFDYPKAWKQKVDDRREFLGVRVGSDKGTGVTLQVYNTNVTAPAVQEFMQSTLRKRFEKRIIAGSEKKSKRMLLGKIRNGQTMTLRVNPTTKSQIAFYALRLPKKKKTLFIIFQRTSDDSTAKKVFEGIAKSLKETGGK